MSALIHDLATCARCSGTAHDLIDEDVDKRGRRTWLLWCSYCGFRVRVDAPPTSERPADTQPAAEEFRFKHGRFAGLTFAETDLEPNGRKYLEWMLANNKALAPRVSAYLRTVTA